MHQQKYWQIRQKGLQLLLEFKMQEGIDYLELDMIADAVDKNLKESSN